MPPNLLECFEHWHLNHQWSWWQQRFYLSWMKLVAQGQTNHKGKCWVLMDLIYVIASRNEHVIDMITNYITTWDIFFSATFVPIIFSKSKLQILYIYIYTVLYIMYEILQRDTMNSRTAVRRNPTNHDVHRICHHSWLGKNMVKHPVLVLSLATHLPIISSVKPSGFNASEGIGYCSAVSTSEVFRDPGFWERQLIPSPILRTSKLPKTFFCECVC